MISKFRRVLNVVCFLVGNPPASEFYMPMFRNTLSHLHRQVGMKNETRFENGGVFIQGGPKVVIQYVINYYIPTVYLRLAHFV